MISPPGPAGNHCILTVNVSAAPHRQGYTELVSGHSWETCLDVTVFFKQGQVFSQRTACAGDSRIFFGMKRFSHCCIDPMRILCKPIPPLPTTPAMLFLSCSVVQV